MENIMKFDANTLQVLKNFSAINKNIMFKAGNVVRTISDTKSVMAKSTINQEIPKSFGIYDLSRFLGTMSLFNEADLDIQDSVVEIREGKNKFKYALSDASLIMVAPDKDIVLPDPEIEFVLTQEALNQVMKALSVSQLPHIAVTGDGTTIYLQAIDAEGKTHDAYSVEVGTTSANFRMVFRADNIKLIPGNYNVQISAKGLSHFKGTNVEYWIAVESSSTYTAN
jgi:hypothetical protein